MFQSFSASLGDFPKLVKDLYFLGHPSIRLWVFNQYGDFEGRFWKLESLMPDGSSLSFFDVVCVSKQSNKFSF
jgi:hypothetical protein